MKNSNYFNCEHIKKIYMPITLNEKYYSELYDKYIKTFNIRFRTFFRQHLKDIEHTALFTEQKSWLGSIIETFRCGKVKTLEKKNLIAIFLKFVDLEVFLARLCGFTFREFWMMEPTLLQTTSTKIYWNRCWRCFLFSWFNFDMNIINNWWVGGFSVIVVTDSYIVRF